LSLLRGRAMECIGQIIVATKNEKCLKDAHSVIQLLIPLQDQEKRNTHESYNYMIKLFANISTRLQSQFVQYLKHIIPNLILSLNLEPAIVSDDTINNNNDRNDRDEISEEKTFSNCILAQSTDEKKNGHFEHK